MEQSDSQFFSQRAKDISLLHKQSSNTLFQFSNRTSTPIADTPVGRGHASPISFDNRQSISIGRGRTDTPVSSSFVLQKENISSSSTAHGFPSPIFVMHDEVRFVQPYFGPPHHNDMQSSSITQKREILLLALKQIESGLKTL